MQTDNDPIFIPLEGVDNEHCALIVNDNLQKIKGIKTHNVEINNSRAIITVDSKNALPEAVKTIRNLGYGVITAIKTIPILNMSCASCAMNVESTLQALPGIINASVNYASASVTVEYLSNMITAESMRHAVQSTGYDLLIEDDENEADIVKDIHDKKLRELKIKTIWSVILTLPVVIIGMFYMHMPYANEIMWILSTPVVLWLGKDFFINAWKQAKHRSANMDTLVALGSGIAYLFSAFNTLFPSFWSERGLQGHVYFEAAAVIITFILLGKLLEERAKGNTSSAIKKLIGLQAETVVLLGDNNQQSIIPIRQVHQGDILLAKPGDKIAVDGVVLNSSSYVDESMLTGEPVPVWKNENDPVFAGTINQKGSFTYKAQKVGSETLLAQIINRVQQAQGSKAPVQKLVDKIAKIFVPIVIGIGIFTFLCWIIWGGENGFAQGLISLATVLVIACPCALGLATPTAIMVGMGKAAEKGILIKDALSLELTKKVNAVVLDKTGTITQGKPLVANSLWKKESNDQKSIVFSIEKYSEHPLAGAIVKHLEGSETLPVSDFQSITGIGVKATVNGKEYLVGSRKLMEQNKVTLSSDLLTQSNQWSDESKTVIWFSNHENALGIFALEDKIKESSIPAIHLLKNKGIEVYMLTGDHESTAQSVAEQTGITYFQAGVMPEQKAEFVKKLQQEGKVVAMVGDGINDSTALAQADVSIAMAKGSDIAMDVANMTIMNSDLMKIAEAIELSQQTVKTIRQNLFWAFIYNIIGIPLAAGILYPVNGFLLNPMIAGAAMALSSVSVVSNSLLLKSKK